MGDQELKEAKIHLEKAEADMQAARAAEAAAEEQIRDAVQEIRKAEGEHHEIHFEVDGEPCETTKHELTPNQIIEEFGKKSPADNYLVQITPGHTESYKGKGDIPIRMHDGMRFQIVSTGPKPVSNGPIVTGVGAFVDGLRAMGYDPKAVKNRFDHIVIDYVVQSGRYTGRSVRLGFVVPQDFPVITPTGPHVSPRIHPAHPASDIGHPLGGIHESQSAAFQQDIGGEWQYWSRPYPGWVASKKTAAAYMSHIYQLWETQ